MKTKRILVVAVPLAVGVPAAAVAHISVPSGPAFAGATQEITLGVGHGCEGAPTVIQRNCSLVTSLRTSSPRASR